MIAERISAAAAMEGLVYNPGKIGRQPNTLDCHRLILWSRSATDPARMKQRLMELYFAEGADLTDPRVLIGAAIDCGMDGDLVRRLLASDADIDRIEGEATTAKEAGIDGVPCFVFGGERHRHRRAIAGISGERHRAHFRPAYAGCGLKLPAPRKRGRGTARMRGGRGPRPERAQRLRLAVTNAILGSVFFRTRQRSSSSEAPSTMLRMAPSPASRGRMQRGSFSRRICARVLSNSNLSNIRSPHERSDMRVRSRSFNVHPGCRFAHPGYEEIRKRNAGKRTVSRPARKRRAGRATEGRLAPPFPLPGALACRRSTTALAEGTYVTQGATQAMLPGTRSERALPAFAYPSPVSTSRADRSIGRPDARAARERS